MGTRLNNFVEELLVAPLREGEFAFENPREGWVYLGFNRAYYGVTGSLDDSPVPVVTFRNPPCGDTMRWLSAGRHVLKVKGATPDRVKGGTLSIRLVKPIIVDARGLVALRGDEATKSLGLDFFRANVFAVANTLLRNPSPADDPVAAILEADLARRGIRKADAASVGVQTAGVAYCLNGKWQALAAEPTVEAALLRLATDAKCAAVESVSLMPTGDVEQFKRVMALLRRHCVQGLRK